MKDFIFLQTCFGGGTGRRAGFKIQFWQQSVGSIPTRSTNILFISNNSYYINNFKGICYEIIKLYPFGLVIITMANNLYTFAL
jgi:hypothetical protein